MNRNISQESGVEIEKHIVAFIDLLGFTEALKEEKNFNSLLSLLQKFITLKKNSHEELIGTNADGNHSYIIHPSISAFSDSLIISYPLGGILPPVAILSELSRVVSHISRPH